jgi:hypothetical protein
MVLKNHIAYRFLTDEVLLYEMMQSHLPSAIKKIENHETLDEDEGSQLKTLNHTISQYDQRAYYITDTILDKVDMLKVKPKGIHFDWTIFDKLPEQKMTFIYSNNTLIRFCVFKGHLCFCWIVASPSKEKPGEHILNFHLFHYNQEEKRFSSNWDDPVVTDMEERIYKLLCFFYFSDNEMIIVEPGRKYGTKKTGKLINTFEDIPVTVVNSNWNITSIRTEGFDVRGHFRLQPCGVGMKEVKMIFIEPFRKKGYIRNAKNTNHI